VTVRERKTILIVTPHIVSVACCASQLTLGQQIISGKVNQLTVIPLLLDLLKKAINGWLE